MTVMDLLKTSTLVITTNISAVHQWIDELIDKTNLTRDDIAEYTGENKTIKPVTVATYQILTWRPEKDGPYPHFSLFRKRPLWFVKTAAKVMFFHSSAQNATMFRGRTWKAQVLLPRQSVLKFESTWVKKRKSNTLLQICVKSTGLRAKIRKSLNSSKLWSKNPRMIKSL